MFLNKVCHHFRISLYTFKCQSMRGTTICSYKFEIDAPPRHLQAQTWSHVVHTNISIECGTISRTLFAHGCHEDHNQLGHLKLYMKMLELRPTIHKLILHVFKYSLNEFYLRDFHLNWVSKVTTNLSTMYYHSLPPQP